jgi:hypothetical protein
MADDLNAPDDIEAPEADWLEQHQEVPTPEEPAPPTDDDAELAPTDERER